MFSDARVALFPHLWQPAHGSRSRSPKHQIETRSTRN